MTITMDSPETCLARTSEGRAHLNTLVVYDMWFVYIQLFSDSEDRVLANTPYTLKGIRRGMTISGQSDADGVLRHEFLPDDHYEIECSGRTERVELYYMLESERYDGTPWCLRMRKG